MPDFEKCWSSAIWNLKRLTEASRKNKLFSFPFGRLRLRGCKSLIPPGKNEGNPNNPRSAKPQATPKELDSFFLTRQLNNRARSSAMTNRKHANAQALRARRGTREEDEKSSRISCILRVFLRALSVFAFVFGQYCSARSRTVIQVHLWFNFVP